MDTHIGSHNLELTDALKNQVSKKIIEPLERLLDSPATRIRVELTRNGKAQHNMECHVTVSVPKRAPLNLTQVDDNMYRAIELLHDRLMHHVRRKIIHHYPGAAA